jgi:hypothetical protein
MGNHENFEANKAADSVQEGKLSNLSAYVMERTAPGQGGGRDRNNGLVEKGILPSMNIMEMSSEIRTGTEASAKETHDAGIKVEHGKDGSTKVEYPTGIKIESTGVSHSENAKGNIKVETSGTVIEVMPPNHQNKKGEVFDEKGRIIAKPNEDGSYTVDSGKGFFTQYPDGTIVRESAIRSRDGKTFEVIDTNSPLGNLRPSDMTHHK